MATPKIYKNLIDGEWVESFTGQTHENLNPADTSDVVGVFQRSGKEDVDSAVQAAKRAFEKWRLVPAPRRAEIIFRAGEILTERKEEFARDMTREMGKVLAETRGDVQEAIDTAYYMAGEGRRMFGQTVPSELPNKFAMSVRMPIGVCGMITPWNFPMAIPSWKLLPAIVCGNTCVIKPAEDTPLSTFNLVRALVVAGLPRGVINIVTGHGPEVGGPLNCHPDVRAISFTGSSEVDDAAGQAAARSFKHCSLEMGGSHTWDELKRLRDRWKRPFVVKGILHPEDAERAGALGADCIGVSNHGGRHFDGAPAAVDVLPAIVSAVGSRASVMIDSGIRGGLDVVRALALGARFCFTGRRFAYPLGALGEAGAPHVADLFFDEIKTELLHVGAQSVDGRVRWQA